MVKVTGYVIKERREDGEPFILLELSGGLEFVQSQQTGKFYATSKKTKIPATFGEDLAKEFVGQTMPGEIVRVPCEAYEYEVPNSDEIITLHHTYSYLPSKGAELIQANQMQLA
ncbi:MAG: hypothetical protein JSR12_11505 [Bacteroidetes bacterium]|nr:hypothetical protein [Bacteroidota bacterium]